MMGILGGSMWAILGSVLGMPVLLRVMESIAWGSLPVLSGLVAVVGIWRKGSLW